MLGIKTRLKKNLNEQTRIFFDKKKLNSEGVSWWKKLTLLTGTKLHLQNESFAYQIGSPIKPTVNPISQFTKIALAKFNPNNLGNWKNFQPYNIPTSAESGVIEIYKNLLRAPQNITGYFTSGATEGNIFCAWAGKIKFKKLGISLNEIALIRNDLTHYSVEKAAKITEIREVISSISFKKWCFDPEELLKTINNLYKQGVRGYLIPITIGHTVGGTDDPLQKICNVLLKFKKKYPKVQFFVWIDAAYSGITKPFLEKNWQPFSFPLVQAVLADFHKTLGVSYPAGIILHKKNLSQLIQTTPSYIHQSDQTLLGSRPGVPAIETLLTLQVYGKKELEKKFLRALEKKKKIIKELSSKISGRVITQNNSLQAALISLTPEKKSLKKLEKEYGISQQRQKINTNEGEKKIFYYKLYFLPEF